MDRETVLVTLLFAFVAAGIAWVLMEGQRRHDAYLADNPPPQVAEDDAYLADNPPPQVAEDDASGRSIFSLDWGNRERVSDKQYWGLPLALTAIGAYVWLLVIAFGEGAGWGFLVLLGNGVGVLVFVLFHPEKALRTALLLYGCGGGRSC
jgi:hypothetical protein